MDTHKQLKQILFPAIKSVLHLFKIHREVVFGNSSVIVRDMLGKRPEALNAVHVVLGSPVDQGLAVTDSVTLAQPFKRVVATERVRVVDRTLPGLLPDNVHQFFLRDMLHNPRANLPIALQQDKYDVFALGASAAHTLASAAKVSLAHLNLAIKFTALKFRYMIDRLAQSLAETGNRLIIKTEITGKAIGRLLLIKSLNDCNLSAYLSQRFLFSTVLVATSDITARSFRYLERTAKNTLPAPSKSWPHN